MVIAAIVMVRVVVTVILVATEIIGVARLITILKNYKDSILLNIIINRNASTNNSSGSGGSSSNGSSCIHSNSHSSTSYVDLFNGSTGAA